MQSLPKFDARAKNALAIAQQISIQLGHSYIGGEHLMFGILSQPQNNLPFQVTFMDNLSSQELLEMIKREGDVKTQKYLSEKGELGKSLENILPEITTELQTSLDIAIKVAEENGYSYIGIEHLMYGVLQTKGSHGQQLMSISETTSVKLREILESLFLSYNRNKNNFNIPMPIMPDMPGMPKRNNFGNSALSEFTMDINQKVAKENEFQIIERSREIDRMIQVLTRKIKNNPIILGEPGVGKTALVEGLAKKINEGNVPEWLLNKRILSLDIPGILAGAVFRGDFESRIKQILEEVEKVGNVILFIDEIHAAVGAGAGGHGGGPDLTDILKPALARGEISVIGATTEDEYRTIIKKDKAFDRRFQVIRLDEPDLKQTINIVRGVKSIYENYHSASFPDEMVEYLVDLSDRFVPERFFPDKAVDILDECLVRARILFASKDRMSDPESKEWVDIEKEILNLIKQKNEAIMNNNAVLSEKFEQDQKDLETKLVNLNRKNVEAKKLSVVTKDILELVISEISGVPLIRISSNVYTQIKNLEEVVEAQIFGQNEATREIISTLKRAYTGINPHNGPIGSYLLLGPTGVGKTEMVKVITKEMYGDPSKYLLKLDMSEFRERHQMSRLLGAPAGYVGYDDAPQLTEFLRKRPYSVILFDEIEKGHPDALNLLLQMLEEGKVTDAKGNSVSCQHAMIFLTSNLGKNQLNTFASKLGFIEPSDTEESDYQSIKNQVMEEVKKTIKPEILGRLKSIVFRPISKTVLEKIITKELQVLQRHVLSNSGRTLGFEAEVVDYLITLATDKLEYGAREVKQLIAKYVQDPLAEFLLEFPDTKNIQISAAGKVIKIETGAAVSVKE